MRARAHDPATAAVLDALSGLPCSVRRIDVASVRGLSEAAFAAHFDREPVMLTGLVREWPASSRWARLFEDDQGAVAAPPPRYANCTVGARSFLAHVARARSPLTAHYRVLLRDFDWQCPALAEDVDMPRWADSPGMSVLRDSWAALPCEARPAFPRSGSRDWRWLLHGSLLQVPALRCGTCLLSA